MMVVKVMLARVLCVCVLVFGCVGSRILVVFPTPDRSYSVLGDALAKNLLSAGHEVTYATAFPKKAVAENLTYIDISSISESGANAYRVDLHTLPLGPPSAPQALQRGVETAQRALQHEAVRELMVDPAVRFDAIVAHWEHSTLLAPLGALFDCPLIWYVAGEASWGALRLVHEEPSPACSVGPHSAWAPSLPLTVKERALQLWYQVYSAVWTRYYTDFVELPIYTSVYSKAMRARGKLLPPYEEVVVNGSLLLANSGPPLAQPVPLPPAAKLIGGHHLELPVRVLPKKLQTFMDNVKQKVILIDLGVNVRSDDLPKHVKSRLLEMFEQLEKEVVWGLDVLPPYRPRNVHVLERAPTLGILCHPNTALFITDGSSSSLMEALHCGVPVVAVPFAGDQFLNADLAVARGFARRVDFTNHFAWTLQEAIGLILANNSYSLKAKEASKIFHLRPQPASAELLHWVHVTTSTGAAHLRSPALDLTLTERLYLDLWLLVALAIWVFTKVVKVIKVHLNDFDYDKKND